MQACVPHNSTRAIIIYNDALDLASFVCFQQETPGSFSPSEVDFLSTLFTTNNSQHHAPHRQCVNKSTAYSSSLQSCVVHSCLDLRGGDGLEIEIRTVENTAHIAAMSWPNPTRLVSSLLMRTSSHPFNTCIPRPLCLGHFVLSFADQKLINNFSNSNPEILHFCVLKDALSTNHGSISLPLHRQCFFPVRTCVDCKAIGPLGGFSGLLIILLPSQMPVPGAYEAIRGSRRWNTQNKGSS